MLAGRGFGKTRAGAEHVIRQHRAGLWRSSALVAPTSLDARKTMLRGPSGILTIAPDDFKPIWHSQDKRLDWPDGSVSHVYYATEPERLRGPEHDGAWCDELAVWKYLEEAWDNLELTMRDATTEGDPEIIVTTTPKPRALLKTLLADPDTVKTGGSTMENAENVSKRWLARMLRRYQGTRTGRQELDAELLDEAEGALWRREWIDENRRLDMGAEDMMRIAIAIDPQVGKDAAETGIVAAGIDESLHHYVLADHSGRYSPDAWARKAIFSFFDLRANVLVAEKNQGGEMVRSTIETTAREMHAKDEIPHRSIPLSLVWASKAKQVRAEPVSALYEQGRVSHCGMFSALEDQLCTWEPNTGDASPDRLDALVYAITEFLDHGVIQAEPISLGELASANPPY
jgi:phage terminase large subunit-like protein